MQLHQVCTITHQSVTNAVFDLFLKDADGLFQVNETLTGSTSLATATIRARNAYRCELVDLIGAFEVNETLTGSESGTTAKANSVALANVDNGVPETVITTQTNIPCRFITPKDTLVQLPSGEHYVKEPHILVAADTIIYRGDQVTGPEDTYIVQTVVKVHGNRNVHHIRAELKRVI